jgi:hypothetical protein
MSSQQTTIFTRAVLQGIRGTVFLTAILGAGYFLVSKSPVAESKAAQVSDDDDEKSAKAPASDSDEAVVKLDPEGQEKGGIETEAPKAITYQDQARAYGVILPLDKLTSLYNSSLTAATQLKTAHIKLEASKIANTRAQNLLKVSPTSAAQAEIAEAAYKLDEAALEAAEAQAETVSNTAIQDWGPILGQAIAKRSALAQELVLHRSCLIQLTLQPGAVASAPTKISVMLGSASTAEATLVSEATQADPKIPNASFFYTIPCVPMALAGMSVVAVFPNGDAKPGVGIPPSAIVWQAGRAWMYVQDGTGRFERRAIGTEASPTADGGYVLPATSWPRDKLIVIAGAQTLLSEESRSKGQPDEDDN